MELLLHYHDKKLIWTNGLRWRLYQSWLQTLAKIKGWIEIISPVVPFQSDENWCCIKARHASPNARRGQICSWDWKSLFVFHCLWSLNFTSQIEMMALYHFKNQIATFIMVLFKKKYIYFGNQNHHEVEMVWSGG